MTNSQSDTSSDAHLVDLARMPAIRSSLGSCFADYSHESNNRLNSLKLSIYLARRQARDKCSSFLQVIDSDYRHLEHQFESFAAICRPLQMTMVPLDFALLVHDRLDRWNTLIAGQGGRVVLEPPEVAAEVRFDAAHLGRALDALVLWRSQLIASGTLIRVSWGLEMGMATFSWSEQTSACRATIGPAVSDQEAWTLAILTRVVAEHRGSTQVQRGANCRVDLQWPALP